MEGIVADTKLCVEVNQRGSYLWETGQWSDCNFLVGVESHRDIIACHKLILSMASPVFEAMFYGDMAEKNDPIPIVDVQPATFKALLEYIYTGKLSLSSMEIAYELCYTAKKYMLLEHVEKECIKYIWKQLNPSNVCQVYEYALLFEAKPLIQKCLQIISMNTKEVLRDSNFQDVELSTVIDVYSLDYLNIDSELDLVEACIRYAKAREMKSTGKRLSLASETSENDTPNSDSPELSASNDKVDGEGLGTATGTNDGSETDTQELTEAQEPGDGAEQPTCGLSYHRLDTKNRLQIRRIVEKIRFLTLSLEQLAECGSILLDNTEGYALAVNIVSSNSDVPMPAGFSKSRIRRHQMVDLGDIEDEARPYANFRYKIQSLSHLTQDVLSPPCYVQNLSWQLMVIPKSSPSQSSDQKKGLVIQCNCESELANWSCEARIVIATVHQTGFPAGFKFYAHSFCSESNSLAIPLEWDVLLNPQNEYITDDAITFEVRMITDEPYAEPGSPYIQHTYY